MRGTCMLQRFPKSCIQDTGGRLTWINTTCKVIPLAGRKAIRLHERVTHYVISKKADAEE